MAFGRSCHAQRKAETLLNCCYVINLFTKKKLIANFFLHSFKVAVSCRDICVLRNLFLFSTVLYVPSQRWLLRNTTASTEK
jgi:hypothetical protein